MGRLRCLLPGLILPFLLSSCVTYKNVPYFKDLPDTARAMIKKSAYRDLVIHPDDLMTISVQTMDPNANMIFNQTVPSPMSQAANFAGGATPTLSSSMSGGVGGASASTFLVDDSGAVDLPVIGKIRIAGLSTTQARDSISNQAQVYYKNPTVNVRFANLKVTVLGEVSRPGTYVLPNEKNTIFDALGLSGDLTIFGKRENALLIRDSADQEVMIRFSLNSKDLIRQPYFFLRQNDVIYIEPNKSKIASLDAVKTRNYTILASILSVILILAYRID